MSIGVREGPYQGLRPFEATDEDAALFFGRTRERDLVAANLVAARLTVLYGESGVGKSFVLRAGLVHTLRRQARRGAGFVVALYAGWSDADPVEGIARAVREAVADVLGSDPGPGEGTLARRLAGWGELVAGDVYLVLDQVDEYFLYHGWHGGPLLDELPPLVTEPGLRVNVLLGIREDALARLDVFKPRIPGLFANSLRLERLDREAARAAIVGPLQRWSESETHVEIEPPLVDAILASVTVAGAAGNGGGQAVIEPPYLQIVMERLWEAEREAGSSALRLETLERLGGGRRIVAEHLDRSLAGLSEGEQDTAAEMFSQLVTPSGAKVAHDVADLAGYSSADEEAVRQVAQRLVAERILRPLTGSGASGRVEIYHDVLAAAAADWRRRHDAERTLREERAASRLRHRRLLVVVVVALLALAAMTGVAIYALVQQREASDARRAAGAREESARALVALPTDPVDALRGAVAASKRNESPAVTEILRTVLLDVRQTGTYGDGSTPVTAAAFLGQDVVTGDQRGRVTVYRPDGSREAGLVMPTPVTAVSTAPGNVLLLAGGDTAALLRGTRLRRVATMRPGGHVSAAVLGGGRVAVAGDRMVGVWAADGRKLWQRPVDGPARTLVLGRSGLLVATTKAARLLDAASGRELARFAFPAREDLLSAAYSERLGLVATGHDSRIARLWDARTGELIAELDGHTGPVVDVAFSTTGEPTLATASSSGSTRLWSASRSPVLVSVLSGHTNPVTSVGFGGGGEIITTSTDRTARVWTRDAQTLAVLAGHTQPPAGATLRGPVALTWSADGTARTWRWPPDPSVTPVGAFSGHPASAALAAAGPAVAALTDGQGELVSGPRQRYLTAPAIGKVRAVGASADGTRVATGQARGAAIWNAVTFNRQGVLATGARVTLVALGADGEVLVTGGASGKLQVHEGGRPAHTIATGLGTLVAGAVSPDGRYVGAGDGSGAAGVWELASGEPVSSLTGHRARITGVAFSEDSRYVATSSVDHDVRIWDTATGRLLHRLGHFAVASGVAFSPNGEWVATAGPQRAVLWEVRTGNQVLKLTGDGRFLAVAFSPDGRTIRTVDTGGGVGAYRCDVCGSVDELRAAAEARLARLTK